MRGPSSAFRKSLLEAWCSGVGLRRDASEVGLNGFENSGDGLTFWGRLWGNSSEAPPCQNHAFGGAQRLVSAVLGIRTNCVEPPHAARRRGSACFGPPDATTEDRGVPSSNLGLAVSQDPASRGLVRRRDPPWRVNQFGVRDSFDGVCGVAAPCARSWSVTRSPLRAPADAPYAGGLAGSSMIIQTPLEPGAGSARTVPPWARISARLIGSPKPDPPLARLRDGSMR